MRQYFPPTVSYGQRIINESHVGQKTSQPVSAVDLKVLVRAIREHAKLLKSFPRPSFGPYFMRMEAWLRYSNQKDVRQVDDKEFTENAVCYLAYCQRMIPSKHEAGAKELLFCWVFGYQNAIQEPSLSEDDPLPMELTHQDIYQCFEAQVLKTYGSITDIT